MAGATVGATAAAATANLHAERLYYPNTQGNRDPIWDLISPRLPLNGKVLEVASGSGEHVAYFSSLRPDLSWQPSDPDAANRASIKAWNSSPTVAQPLDLDVSRLPWAPMEPVDAVLAINLIHIAPWEACLGLLQGAAPLLKKAGFLYFYGALRRAGQDTAPSNRAFDLSLRSQDPRWGVRDLESVLQAAADVGLTEHELVEMPVNNFSLFLKAAVWSA